MKEIISNIKTFLRENPNNKTYILFIFVIVVLTVYNYYLIKENKTLNERVHTDNRLYIVGLDSLRLRSAKALKKATEETLECQRESKQDFKELSESYFKLFYLNK